MFSVWKKTYRYYMVLTICFPHGKNHMHTIWFSPYVFHIYISYFNNIYMNFKMWVIARWCLKNIISNKQISFIQNKLHIQSLSLQNINTALGRTASMTYIVLSIGVWLKNNIYTEFNETSHKYMNNEYIHPNYKIKKLLCNGYAQIVGTFPLFTNIYPALSNLSQQDASLLKHYIHHGKNLLRL